MFLICSRWVLYYFMRKYIVVNIPCIEYHTNDVKAQSHMRMIIFMTGDNVYIVRLMRNPSFLHVAQIWNKLVLSYCWQYLTLTCRPWTAIIRRTRTVCSASSVTWCREKASSSFWLLRLPLESFRRLRPSWSSECRERAFNGGWRKLTIHWRKLAMCDGCCRCCGRRCRC